MNHQPAALLVAGCALAAYVLLCWRVWRRAKARRAASGLFMSPDVHGPRWLVAHASQTGTAESLAAQTVRALRSVGLAVDICSFAQLDVSRLQSAQGVLILVSTYGEGDAPDSAAHFVSAVMRNDVDLSSLRYGLLMLGDRSYRNYCGFGRQLEDWLKGRGALPLFDAVDVDSGDPVALQTWRQRVGEVVPAQGPLEWQEVPFDSWVLCERRRLNPGSSGGAVFHLEFTRQDGVVEPWQSGDLLQIQVPTDPGRPRDYSIASIPADGAVHLLVRLGLRPDGTPGLASGWLTRDLPLGSVVQARLREHNGFRLGENASRDLILIGNGTGLAGLRAHLKQCALGQSNSSARRWLIFGERQAAHDSLYADDLAAWQAKDLLTRLDLVYSRDGAEHRHVQDRLRAQSDRLAEWIHAGAAIYVCGSRKGMAEGVDQVLREVLGEATLQQLQQQGRYRRDVY